MSVDALRVALNRLVERHDALRSRVQVDAEGVPGLRFANSARLRLELRGTSALDDVVAEAFVRQFANRPIPVNEAPMLTAGLLRADAENAACLVLCLQHLIADQPQRRSPVGGAGLVLRVGAQRRCGKVAARAELRRLRGRPDRRGRIGPASEARPLGRGALGRSSRTRPSLPHWR